MAFHLNECRFAGRIAADAEPPRTTKNGRLVKFRMAVGRSKKNPQTGQYEDGKTLWLDVVYFGSANTDWMVDRIVENGGKGTTVYVAGEMETEEWDDKNNPGQKRSKNVLIARDVQFPDRQAQGSNQPKQQTPMGDSDDPFGASNAPSGVNSDSVPF